MKEELFSEYLSLAEKETGISIPASHVKQIRRDLEKLLKKKGVSEEEFLTLLSRNSVERRGFLNLVTINETYFFREEKHFLVLEKELLPKLLGKKKRLLLWSVSCSTGEEPVSLALLLEKNRSSYPGLDYTLFASDINTTVLENFSTGTFTKNSLRRDGKTYHPLLADYGRWEDNPVYGKRYLLKPEILEKIRISRLNLLRDPLDSIPQDLDIIFFRNTLIYMEGETRDKILSRILPKLSPGGYLFLASSEIPFVYQTELELQESLGVYFFRKHLWKQDFPEVLGGAERFSVVTNPSKEKGSEKSTGFNLESMVSMGSPAPRKPVSQGIRKVSDPGDPQRAAYKPGDLEIWGKPALKEFLSRPQEMMDSFLDTLNKGDFNSSRKILEKLKNGFPSSAMIPFLEGTILRGQEIGRASCRERV